jgi:hypothetical protein
MDMTHRHQTEHPHNAMLGAGGIALMLLLIAIVLAMSTRSTQLASSDAATIDHRIGAPPYYPYYPDMP